MNPLAFFEIKPEIADAHSAEISVFLWVLVGLIALLSFKR
jgi:hypothetical protein